MELILATWMVVNILGLGVASWGAWDALQDIKALGDRGNGRRIAARATMRAQSLRFCKFAIFSVIGAVAMLDGDSSRLVARTGLLAAAIIMFADSTMDWRARRKLWRQIEERNRREKGEQL